MMRPRRKPALDPRLLIGLGLVIASISGVVALVSTADRTVPVLAAPQTLVPGDEVGVDDLVVVDVRLASAAGSYLAEGDVPEDGLVVTRPIGAGELIPVDAVGSTEGQRLSSLVLDVGGTLAASVRPGSVVDVWAASKIEGGRFGPPSVIVPGAVVTRLVQSESVVAGGATTAVEVLVPHARIARVLDAVANADAVSMVPSAIPVR